MADFIIRTGHEWPQKIPIGGTSLPVLEDGTLVGDAKQVNFTGTGVVVTVDGLNPDQIDIDIPGPGVVYAAPIVASPPTREVGDNLINPTITATFDPAPSGIPLIDDGSGPLAMVMVTPTLWQHVYAHTYVHNSQGSTTWTVTANGHSASATTNWVWRRYWGTAPAGSYDSAFVNSLPSSDLTQSVPGIYDFGDPDSTWFFFFAWPTIWGAPLWFTSDGFGVDFDLTIESPIFVVNGFGQGVLCNLYISTYPQGHLGSVQVS